jgi:hypothetical protein
LVNGRTKAKRPVSAWRAVTDKLLDTLWIVSKKWSKQGIVPVKWIVKVLCWQVNKTVFLLPGCFFKNSGFI